MAKEFTVAIELGSSKMTGIAGRKNSDGSMTILAVAQEDSTSYIRKGVVYNIDKTAQGLSNIISKLKNTLQADITQVYVGIGGQSIHGIKNTVIKDLPIDAIVSQDMVNELMDTNRNMTYPEYEIQDAVTEEYKVDSQYQDDPVGIQAKHLEGNFLNIVWRRSFYRSLNKSLENAGITIAEMYLSPLVMADNVLTEAEKRAGCVLVDLGAQTTTMSVYYRNKLRYIAVIPLGGNNITKDLESLLLEESDAETLKLKYGSAYTEPTAIDKSEQVAVNGGHSVSKLQLAEVIEARALEIIENVRALIPGEYTEKLLGGIVLTGGGSNMKNIETAFRKSTSLEKVRIAKSPNININSKDSVQGIAEDGTMNTILSLVAKGTMNCAGRDFNDSLFGNATDDEPAAGATVAQPSPYSTPITDTTATTRAEQTRRAAEQTAQPTTAAQQPAEEKPLNEEHTEHRKSFFSRIANSITKFGKSLVEPETENN